MIYWIILVVLITSIFLRKISTTFLFKAAILFFLAGAILRVINLLYPAEILMRVDFILWLAIFFLAVKENKFENEA